MLIGVMLLLLGALVVAWHLSQGRHRPLDSDEIRVIRGVADRVKREQSQPFEW